MVRAVAYDLDTPGNRRASSLLIRVTELATRVLVDAPSRTAETVSDLRHRLTALALREPFRSLIRRRAYCGLSQRPLREEIYDERYASAYRLSSELERDRHWDPQLETVPEWAYAGMADQIYQRFCAHLLADYLGLTSDPAQVSAFGASFADKDWLLWVDRQPPSWVVQDWRDRSSRPARLRPDLTLFHRPTGRAALMDAKYRRSGERASDDSLTDVQLYLQAYGRRTVGVLYPFVGNGELRVHRVADEKLDTSAIYEIPFVPEPRMAEFISSVFMETLDEMLEP
jgi:hypothetical protein